MNKNSSMRNWLLDASLFTAFLDSFWLDLTGISIHQWLGVGTAFATGLHLLLHWDWVKSVSARFFGRTSKQARAFYLVDVLLLIGFASILFSGLVISTWFSLSLSQPALWINLHILVSVLSLLVLLVKIGIHWRWISKTAVKLLQLPAPMATNRFVPQTVELRVNQDRRAFLKLMGVTSAAAFLSVAGVILPEPSSAHADNSLEQASISGSEVSTTPTGEPVSPTSTPEAEPEAIVSEAQEITPEATATPNQAVQAETQLEPTISAQSSSSSMAACSVRCNHGCSYPGHCRKYTDSNANNRCDWGECL